MPRFTASDLLKDIGPLQDGVPASDFILDWPPWLLLDGVPASRESSLEGPRVDDNALQDGAALARFPGT